MPSTCLSPPTLPSPKICRRQIPSTILEVKVFVLLGDFISAGGDFILVGSTGGCNFPIHKVCASALKIARKEVLSNSTTSTIRCHRYHSSHPVCDCVCVRACVCVCLWGGAAPSALSRGGKVPQRLSTLISCTDIRGPFPTFSIRPLWGWPGSST